jgi:large subunit ribosomal protein L25
MSDQIVLEVQTREVLRKGLRKLRIEGIVPGVIHDHGNPSVYIQVKYQDVSKAYREAGKHHPVQVTAGGKKYTTIIKDVTYDPHYNAMSHIVFGAVNANEKVSAEIPVRAAYEEGNDSSPAERAGLIVLEQLTTVEVKALSKDLPDVITYDAEKLVEVGDQITVADLHIPKNVTLETETTHTIATVFEPSALAAANDEAGGDAEAEDASDVDSEHESTAEEGTQAAETSPGGKEQKESKDQGQNPQKN